MSISVEQWSARMYCNVCAGDLQTKKGIVSKKGDPVRILVVDNDRDLVEMLTSWLKTLGYEVCRAYSGERARMEWLSQQPDLVILDPTLKDVDGLAMCRELRSTHDALILVLTATGDVQDE